MFFFFIDVLLWVFILCHKPYMCQRRWWFAACIHIHTHTHARAHTHTPQDRKREEAHDTASTIDALMSKETYHMSKETYHMSKETYHTHTTGSQAGGSARHGKYYRCISTAHCPRYRCGLSLLFFIFYFLFFIFIFCSVDDLVLWMH